MRRLFQAALLTSLTVMFSGQASAQGLFESLFGAPARVQPPPPPLPAPGSYRAPVYNPYLNQAPISRPEPAHAGGQYRTLCVRMCDGYYWPISATTRRSGFYRDANACRASCGAEASLFFLPAGSDQIGDMTDLTGRVYARLPTAFRYRKALVDGCRCKPDPWARSEVERHREYAEAEREQRPADANAVIDEQPTDTPTANEDPGDPKDAAYPTPVAAATEQPGPPHPAPATDASIAPRRAQTVPPRTRPSVRHPRPVRRASATANTPPWKAPPSRWPGD